MPRRIPTRMQPLSLASQRARCINCSLLIPRNLRSHSLKQASLAVIKLLQSWIHPTTLSSKRVLCTECLTLLQDRVNSSDGSTVPPPELGHRSICLSCGISMLRTLRTYPVRPDRPERDILLQSVPLHLVSKMERVCSACWRAALRKARLLNQHNALSGPPAATSTGEVASTRNSVSTASTSDVASTDDLDIPQLQQSRQTAPSFPKAPHLNEIWKKFCNNQVTWTPKTTSTICSAHFTTADYRIHKENRRRLLETAIPSQIPTCICPNHPLPQTDPAYYSIRKDASGKFYKSTRGRARDTNQKKKQFMESHGAEKNKKRPKNRPKKYDSAAYLREREKANARKKRFLEKMTDEQREIKRLKDKICYQAKKTQKPRSIAEMNEQEKREQREKWKNASKKYRERKKVLTIS